jgi:pilus assembly protein CpaB
MRNKRLILALAGAVICGLLAVMLVTRYIATVKNSATELNNIVVAKTEIPIGAKITAEQLALLPIPNGSAPEGVFRKLSDAVDRVAVIPIGVREPITNLKLAPAGTDSGLGAVIPAGYRALTVKVDEIVGVSGFVNPGSYVDVVAVIVPVNQGQAAQGPISKIVLQNIKVLASGAKLDTPSDQRQPTQVNAVTLLVTPEQAEKLVLAANESKLQLVMRNFGDQEDTQTAGANKNSLLSGETIKGLPPTAGEKVAETKPATTAPKPKIRRTSYEAPREVKTTAPPLPVSRNSIELIEGAKRREVDIPNDN